MAAMGGKRTLSHDLAEGKFLRMLRSVLIVSFAAISGSMLGVMSWLAIAVALKDPAMPAIDQLLIRMVTEPFFLLIAAATLVLTIPCANLLLGTQYMLAKRALSQRAQVVLTLAVGPLAGAAFSIPLWIVLQAPLFGAGLVFGACLGFSTAVVFLWLSSFRARPAIPG